MSLDNMNNTILANSYIQAEDNSTNIRLKASGDKIKSFSFPLKELKNKSIADMPLSHSA